MMRMTLPAVGLVLAVTAQADQAPFERGTHEITDNLEQRSTAAVRGWAIQPDTELIRREPDHLVLALPDQTDLVVERQRVFSQSPYSTSWAGLDTTAGAEVLLTVRGEWMGGLIQLEDRTWEVRPDAEHGTVLLELDTAAFPECSGGIDAPSGSPNSHLDHAHQSGPRHRHTSAEQVRSGRENDPVIMDLLALYTPAARQALGGTQQIEAHAEAAIANANHAFDNSRVDAFFRVAAIEQIDYSESNNCTSDLGWLQNDKTANQLRDDHGADMVGMLTAVGYCGCGYVMRNPGPQFQSHAFQVTATHCAVGNLTYAHEHGHNMGMEHDPANGTSPGNASYPWSFGHYVSGQFRTVMSYSNQCSGGCPRRMHFSNPDVLYAGHPTGIREERDNASTARMTAPIVADFRDPPSIHLDPPSLSVTVEEGSSTSHAFTISNVGEALLDWSVTDAQDDCELAQWLTVTPHDGALDGGASEVIEVVLDTEDLDPGMHESSICISSNDPDNPLLSLEVVLEVTEPKAVITGTVVGLGHCNAAPKALAGAEVTAHAPDQDYSATTAADGSFSFELAASASPVQMSASKSSHQGYTIDDEFDLAAGDTLVIDFELALDQPCAEISPNSLYYRLVEGTANQTVTISNAEGNTDLTWSTATGPDCLDPTAEPWIELSSYDGGVAAGSTYALEVDVDASEFDIGLHQSSLCVQTSDEQQATEAVPIHLEVVPADILNDRFESPDTN